MNKKIIAVMIVATLLFVGLFAACNKDEEDVDKLYLQGDEYPFLTDEYGNKLLDENGEYIVYQTDEDGKYKRDENGDRITVLQAFEAYSESNVVEDYYYKITLPENWKIDESKRNMFVNGVTGDSMYVTLYDKSYQDAYKSNFNTYEQLRDSKEIENVTVTWEENIQLEGCIGVVRFTMSTAEQTNVLYIFKNAGNIYKILYESKSPSTAAADSMALLQTITFKPYDYYEPVTDEKGREVEDIIITQGSGETTTVASDTTAASN